MRKPHHRACPGIAFAVVFLGSVVASACPADPPAAADPHANAARNPHTGQGANPHASNAANPHGAAATQAAADPAAEAQFLTNIRQLTFAGKRAGEGYFSADGTKMIFQSERDPKNPFYQIYLLDLETGDLERVSPGQGKTTCSWLHPDGKHALFASTHADPNSVALQEAELADRAAGKQKRYAWDYDEHYDIYSCDLTQTPHTYTNLTNARGYDAEGDYSPDGKQIVFSSNRHAYADPPAGELAERFARDPSLMLDIYLMNADGTNVRRLTDTLGYDGGPFFSPDGQRIIWRRFDPEGTTAEIFTMKLDGSDVQQLTHLQAMSWAPYLHPSGQYAIFTTNKHGFDNFELYIVDADGRKEPVRITYTPGWDGLPVFSPDGKKLAWSTKRTSSDGTVQIFIAEWNHEAALQALGKSAPLGQTENPPRTAQAIDTHTTSPDINPADVRQYVTYLASDALEGRLTGSPGEKLATTYVADHFKQWGLAPAGDNGTYFQEFTFTYGVGVGPKCKLTATISGAATDATVDTDWRPLTFSKTGTVEAAPVAFAGYGLVAPEDTDQPEYDSFVHSDVKGKWVIVLRYLPEGVTPERRQHLNRYASLRYKAMILRDKGAAGMIVVSGPNSQVNEQLIPLEVDAVLSGTSIPAVCVTNALADKLLAAAGKNLKEVQDKLDTGEPMLAFDLPDVKLGGEIGLAREQRTGRNVLGLLKSATANDAPELIVCAHVDHLGRGGGSNSRAKPEEKHEIHHGADDNASGVAGVLEIAEYLAHQVQSGKFKPQRDVLFATWSGEELGLLGSAHFVDALKAGVSDPNLGVAPRVAAVLNMDMIGRLRDKLTISGIGSAKLWKGEIEQRNVPIGLPLSLVDDSYLPTDSTSFYLASVPGLSVFTGVHDEYHTPRDTADTLNYEGAAQVTKLVAGLTRGLALREDVPQYVAQTEREKPGARAGLRVYLGTIPDYAESPIPGLKLSGVSAGGPAEKAGLRGGDIIVELAGRKIENVYDYTYAIDALKIGTPADVVVMRDGERVKLSITPGSRE